MIASAQGESGAVWVNHDEMAAGPWLGPAVERLWVL